MTTRQRPKLALPAGNRVVATAERPQLALPAGSRVVATRERQQLALPQSTARTVTAEQIRGLYEDLAPTVRPLGYASYVRNLWRVGKGAAGTRPGRQDLADLGGSSVSGLVNFPNSGNSSYLVASCGTSWYGSRGGSFSLIHSNGWYGARVVGAVFQDNLILVNGYDTPQLWDGTGSTTPIYNNMPIGAYICSAYNSLFLAGIMGEPNQLYVSGFGRYDQWYDTVDADGNPDRADANVFHVNGSDGDDIRWLTVFRSTVTIFKRHSVYELHGPEAGQPSDYWHVVQAAGEGTPCGQTIVEIDSRLYWLSDNGVIVWGGAKCENLSEPVRATINRINWDAIDKASAGSTQTGQYVLSVPVDGAATPNLTLVYDTIDGSWWIWDGWNPTSYARARRNGQDVLCHGDADGMVYEIGGTTDNGSGIEVEMIFGPTTGGVSARDRWMRRLFVVASVSGGYLDAQVAPSDTAAFGGSFGLANSGATTRMKHAIPLPREKSLVYAPRVRVYGSGTVLLQDVALEWTESET